MVLIIIFRKSRHTVRSYKLIRSCGYVQLLFPHIIQTGTEEFVMVEKAHNPNSIGLLNDINKKQRKDPHTYNATQYFPLQLQFAILVIHFVNPIFFFECGHPKFLAAIGVTQNFFMFLLFSDFYYKAYVKKRN